jgi:hypothetical protein
MTKEQVKEQTKEIKEPKAQKENAWLKFCKIERTKSTDKKLSIQELSSRFQKLK